MLQKACVNVKGRFGMRKTFAVLSFWLCLSLIVLGSYQMFPKSFNKVLSVEVISKNQPLTHHNSDRQYLAVSNSVRVTAINKTTSANCSEGFYNEPITQSTSKYFWKEATVDCKANVPDLLVVKNGTVLKINWAKAKSLKKSIDYCKYSALRRADDFRVTSQWGKTFTESITIPTDVEHIWGQCFKGKVLVGQSYISIIRKKPEKEAIHEKNYKDFIDKNKPKETLSVMLLGIDGTSKNNMARTLVKTKKYILEEMGAIELYRLNKVGINTFPNILPLLTGYSEDHIRKSWTDKEYLDKINHLFIWEEAKKAGYRTAILFDMIKITAFHYLKKGWNHSPFDYYHRPVVVNSERDKVARKASSYCLGDRPEITHLYDYPIELTAVFNNTRTTPYFSYAFYAKLTHDFINRASRADDLYLQIFQKLVRQKSLNNTLFVFFSDHGCRYGKFRYTYRGMQEDNNPFMFFIFPPWFKSKYPKIMANLYKNQHRLLTNYDIHATLQDILNFQGDDIATRKINKTVGISLFNELPQRSCEEAAIPIKYCNCRSVSNTKGEPGMPSKISDCFLRHVIGKTAAVRDKCVQLRLNSTINVIKLVTTSKTDDFYHATIMTSPGSGVFETTIKSPKSSKGPVTVTGDVVRINMYKGQADCVSDARMRSFCYCKNLL